MFSAIPVSRSLRIPLRSNIWRQHPCSTGLSSLRPRLYSSSRATLDIAIPVRLDSGRKINSHFLFKAAGVVGIGLGLSVFTYDSNRIHCEPLPIKVVPTRSDEFPPPPTSSVSLLELSFGTVCGVCTGVFVKKGAKALAFVLGGVFVLLQYLGSLAVLRVDWIQMGKRFENLVYTKDVNGVIRAPNVISVWRWLINFLTANFQQRASFIAGFALGLRIG